MHNIRQATIDDAEVIDFIWRQRLDEDQPPNEESLQRFRKMLAEQDDVFKCWVLEEEGKVVGWVSFSPMRNSPALRTTMAEISGYLSREIRGQSLGTRLHDYAFAQLANTPVEWVLGFVGKSNHALHGLRKRWAFVKLGELPPVDKKPDRDVVEIWALPLGKIVEKESET